MLRVEGTVDCEEVAAWGRGRTGGGLGEVGGEEMRVEVGDRGVGERGAGGRGVGGGGETGLAGRGVLVVEDEK